MGSLGEIIRDAFSGAKVSATVAARMIGVEEGRFADLVSGTQIPTPLELDAVAQTFGITVQELQAGEAASSPLRDLFFRAESEGGGLARDLMIDLGVHRGLGEFVRCSRDAAELAELLGDVPAPTLPEPPASILGMLTDRPPHGGDLVAEWFRQEMRLGTEPISSLQALVEQLGIKLFWVTPEVLATSVEGASACSPTPAILVNLVEGPDCWWRTRMTLGHELCHLLCDRLVPARRFAILSPDERETGGRWRLYQEFEAIERRARAFGACLLAPAPAVVRLVGSNDPTSEQSIASVGKVFGLGRTAAINRLATVFRFGKSTRAALVGRAAQHWYAPDHPDRITGGIGLRAGVVRHLAERAFVVGKLDALRVREYLRIPLTEPLPPDWQVGDPSRLAPLRTTTQRVLGIVEQYVLDEIGSDTPLHPVGCEPSEGGWRVALATASGEGRGHVIVGYDLDHVEPHLLDVA
jgi:hypothetical protein